MENQEKLVDLLLILFVRMSDKNRQQQTINEIRQVLRTMGAGGFGDKSAKCGKAPYLALKCEA